MSSPAPQPNRFWSTIRTVSLVSIVLLWCLAVAMVVTISKNDRMGIDIQRAVTAAAVTLAGAITLLWFVVLAPVSGKVRAGVGLATFALVGTLFGLLRLEEVDGGLWPRFVWRWAPKADELLAQADTIVPVDSEGIDLTSTTHNDFPQFMGPNRNLRLEGPPIATNWDEQPPRLVWKQPIGAGWSAFVAVNGYGITQEQRGEEELVTCYDIATGKLIWANAVSQRHETVMGGAGPRATPAVDEGHVYAMGAGGLFRCLKGTDGSERWRRDLLAETGVTSDEAGIAWGRAGSPLVLGSLVIVPLGGPNGGPYVSLLACDKLTGEIVWKAGDMQISYASPTLVQLQQVEQILIVLEDHVAAFDPVQGSLLWKHPWPGGSTSAANVSNAVAVDEGRVFVSKGYAQGAMLLNVSRDESGTWSTDVVWENPVVMKSKFSNVVYQDGYLYGLDDVVLSCIDVETGRRAWKKGRYGYGQILLVGDTLLVLGEEGQLAAVAADPDQYRPLAEIAAIEGKTWNNLCLYGNYILVRNSQEAACYELPLLTSPNDESATATETKRDHSGNASGNSSPGSSGNST